MTAADFDAVTKDQFDAFVAAYPRPLTRDVATIYEPPLVSFNDFSLAPKWPQSIVASYVLGYGPDDPPSGWKVRRDLRDVVAARGGRA